MYNLCWCKKCVMAILIIGGVCIFIMKSMWLYPPLYSNQNSTAESVAFGRITNGSALKQIIAISETTTLDAIEIQFATYSQRINSYNQVLIYKGDKLMFFENIYAYEIVDNVLHRIDHINLPVQIGDEISIVITSNDATSSNAATTWIKETSVLNGELYVYDVVTGNFIERTGELSMVIYKKMNIVEYLSDYYLTKSQLFLSGLFFLIIGFVCIMFYILFNFDGKEEKNEANHSDSVL